MLLVHAASTRSPSVPGVKTEIAIGLASAGISAFTLGHQVLFRPRARQRERSKQERRDAARGILEFLPELDQRLTAARFEEAELGRVADELEQLAEALRLDLSPDLRARVQEVPPLLRDIERLDLTQETVQMIEVAVYVKADLERAAGAEATGQKRSPRTIPPLSEAQDLLARGQQLRTGLRPYVDECRRRVYQADPGSTLFRRTYLQGVAVGGVFGASSAYLLTQWL